MAIKKFVPVIARFEEDGIITPQKVIWRMDACLKLIRF